MKPGEPKRCIPFMGRSNRMAIVVALSWLPVGCRTETRSSLAPPYTLSPAGESHRLPKTLSGALQVTTPAVKDELGSACRRASVKWPPARVQLLAFKRERILEVWGANRAGAFALIARYPILAASGTIGPKRREGDMQVPEGFYKIDSLNPASRFHLSLRVSYPNSDDLGHATVARARMGGDIYIHGSAVSAGCIAIGDAAIERVFTLVALSQPDDRRIIISPVDFRAGAAPPEPSQPCVNGLYARIREKLKRYPYQTSLATAG